MKIAYVCPRFYPEIGGVETHVYEIARRMAKKYDVEVLTTTNRRLPKKECNAGILIRRFKSFSPSNAYHFSTELYTFIKKYSNEYDLIHAHSYHALPAVLAALATENENFIFTPHYHGKGHTFFRNILHKPYKLIGRQVFNKAKKIICVSNFERMLILRNFNINPDRLCVIPNGIDLREFRKYYTTRKKNNIRKILYVGRLEKYKGVEYIIKALSKLSKDYVLEIVGSGPFKRNLIDVAKKYNVLDRIVFYQNLKRQELIKKYWEASVLVLLSKYEAYGIVVAEALVAKTPCIVANTSALSEWIDNKNVFGVELPVNLNYLATLIEKASSVEVSEINNILTWDEVARRIDRIYGDIVCQNQ